MPPTWQRCCITACPTSTGPGSISPKAANWCWGRSRGQPACVRIAWGNGVCGTAAARGETVLVRDVHDFPGHIACDPVSQSELVVPLIEDGRVTGVLDLDSPRLARFDAEEDRAGCEHLVSILLGARS